MEYKLGGMMTSLFNCSPYTALNYAYPNTYKPWEMAMSPINTWDDETAILATKWLIDVKLKWTEDEIKNNINIDSFIENALQGMLYSVYDGSVKKAILSAYPQIKEEELIQFRMFHIYTEEEGIELVRELIEEKLKWNKEKLKKNISYEVFAENGLENLINQLYNGSPYKAIDSVYKNEFKPWEFNKLPKEARSYEVALEALTWLFEIKLKWTDEQYKKKLNYEVFRQYGLIGILDKYFNCSPYKAFNSIYPNKIKPWEFKKSQQRYWNDETVIEAITWLVEDKLKIEPRMALLVVSNAVLIDNSLGGILKTYSAKDAILITYGEMDDYSDIEIYEMVYSGILKNYPYFFWEENNNARVNKIVRYVFETKLKWGENEIIDNYKMEILEEYKLSAILIVLNYSAYELLDFVYPNKIKPWELKSVPTGYWSKEKAIEAVYWTLKEKLNINKAKWSEVISYKWLKQNRLEKILKHIKISELKQIILKY